MLFSYHSAPASRFEVLCILTCSVTIVNNAYRVAVAFLSAQTVLDIRLRVFPPAELQLTGRFFLNA